ncbi:uncharacterized protein YALI1_C10382g [Yarrowia lipolytica]|uniref:Uncharacterized protein n=1 Tax=Yarrowia lipolytica TaxID=4952 RepID=A0A1D8NA49_YARLL|nr:hypothetical protein YALI1_C10382g [Yarrowia lipolytica]
MWTKTRIYIICVDLVKLIPRGLKQCITKVCGFGGPNHKRRKRETRLVLHYIFSAAGGLYLCSIDDHRAMFHRRWPAFWAGKVV